MLSILPDGGEKGFFLVKKSGSNHDVEFRDYFKEHKFSLVHNADNQANITTLISKYWFVPGGKLGMNIHLIASGTVGGDTEFLVDLPIIGGVQMTASKQDIADPTLQHAYRIQYGMGAFFWSTSGWRDSFAEWSTQSKMRFVYVDQPIFQSQLVVNGGNGNYSSLKFPNLLVQVEGATW